MNQSTHVQPSVDGQGLGLERNYPATIPEAERVGRCWPDGLLHNGERPKTLRESLTAPREEDK